MIGGGIVAVIVIGIIGYNLAQNNMAMADLQNKEAAHLEKWNKFTVDVGYAWGNETDYNSKVADYNSEWQSATSYGTIQPSADENARLLQWKSNLADYRTSIIQNEAPLVSEYMQLQKEEQDINAEADQLHQQHDDLTQQLQDKISNFQQFSGS